MWCAHFAFVMNNIPECCAWKIKPEAEREKSSRFWCLLPRTSSSWRRRDESERHLTERKERGEIKKNIIFRWFILFIRWDHLSHAFTLFLHQPRGDLQVWSGFISFSTLLITVCFACAYTYTLRLSLSSSIYILYSIYIFFRESLPLLIECPRLNDFNFPPLLITLMFFFSYFWKCYPTLCSGQKKEKTATRWWTRKIHSSERLPC